MIQLTIEYSQYHHKDYELPVHRATTEIDGKIMVAKIVAEQDDYEAIGRLISGLVERRENE